MAHYRDLRELMAVLEGRGKLYRFKERINKDTELYPLYRVQMRGLGDRERKVLLFEDVTGAKGQAYEMSVLAGVYGVSEEILALGMSCGSYREMWERWHEGLVHPVDPVVVDSGPVQEEVHVGDEVKELGLDEFPVPVEEPGFSGMIRTGLPMITKDLETGIRNVGTYNGFFRARDRVVVGISYHAQAMNYHWRGARRMGKELPVAIVIGCNVEVMLAGSARLPYGMDELTVAGGAVGSPVELVRCKSIPLEVPAYAEAVIEGVISTEVFEPRLPFGEYPGYINADYNVCPVMQVTAITHRKRAMFTPVLVGFAPSDTNVIHAFVQSAHMYHHLKYECGFPVEEIYIPLTSYNNFCLIRVGEGTSQEIVRQVFEEAPKAGGVSKYTIVVDSDINLRDPDLLVWALSFRTQPKEDFTFLPGGTGGLDPSAASPGSGRGRMSSTEGKEYYRVAINATRKWPYPPVALPRKEYMDRALQIWEGHRDLPAPTLREPWYGYELGNWDEKFQAYAGLITQGDYLKIGEETAKLQRKLQKDME
jgi:4-hydroxy-3-polyprenylbenzoate decarboxylase